MTTGWPSEPPIHEFEQDRKMSNRVRSKQRNAERETASAAGTQSGFRRLKWSELVIAGDYVKAESLGFQPWEGPGGFRAGSFTKPVYRMKRTTIPGLP